MNRVMMVAVLLVMSSVAYGYEPYQPYEYKSPEVEVLKYNTFESKWSYEEPATQLKYNTFENEWSYEKPNARIKYNVMENKWEY